MSSPVTARPMIIRWISDVPGQFGAGVVFQDVDSIQPGDDFAAAIETAVGACAVLLAVIGPQWLTAEEDAGPAAG
jgi:hypothetical protein